MGSEKEEVARPASSDETASSVRFWDADRDPALGLESIGVDTLAHRHALLLVAGAAVCADGWAHGAAVALAHDLAEHGRRVVLADLDFAAPALHARLGETNADGLADVLWFGASLEYVTLTASARRFALIPAGTDVPDPRAVLEDPGWTRLLARFETGGDPAVDLLLAFAPAQTGGLGTLARRVGAAVVLGLENEREAIEAALPADVQRIASFAPDVSAAHEPGSGHAAQVSRPIAGGPHETVTAVPVVEDAAAAAPADGWDEASRRRLARGLTLVVLLLLSMPLGLWHRGPHDADSPNGATDIQAAAAQTPQAGAPAPVAGLAASERLPYAVAIEIHRDMASAARRVESLEREAAAVGFFVAPILGDSAIAYRVLAGPVRDSAAAATLMDWLVDNGHTTGRSEWGIRARPYAFLLGEYDRRDQAEQRRAQLADRDIPSYVLEMPYDAAPSRYFLYAGAYSGAADAEVMRRLLRDQGLADTLVERRGRSPQ